MLVSSGLVFRTRRSDDIIICDFCQHYRCDWLEFSPKRYPRQCPEARELQIAEGNIERAEFLRRTELAKKVGVFRPEEKRWFLSAEMARDMTAGQLAELMANVGAWSTENNFTLSGMVRYKDETRKSAPRRPGRGESGRRTARAKTGNDGKRRTVQAKLP